MDKKLDLKVIVTTTVSLLPIILGIINGFFSNLFLTFMIPVVFATINVLVIKYIDKYEKSYNNASVSTYQCRWIIPIVSIVVMCIVISKTMRIESPIYYIIMSLIGIYFCSSGIKLIESKKEAKCIFKLSSFITSKNANCEKFDTIGYIWIVSGIIFTLLVYLRVSWFIIGLLLSMVMFIAPLLIFNLTYKHVK